MEGPFAIEVPSVIDDKHAGRNAVAVVELCLPLSHYVEYVLCLGVVDMFTAGSGIVAVDLEFVPCHVCGNSTPGHCTLALAVCQE